MGYIFVCFSYTSKCIQLPLHRICNTSPDVDLMYPTLNQVSYIYSIPPLQFGSCTLRVCGLSQKASERDWKALTVCCHYLADCSSHKWCSSRPCPRPWPHYVVKCANLGLSIPQTALASLTDVSFSLAVCIRNQDWWASGIGESF